MKRLSRKNNPGNVALFRNKVPGLNVAGVTVTAKTIKFGANEKNGELSPLAAEVLKWAVENGFEMVARPVGKPVVNREILNGTTQDVLWQWTNYTLK